MLLGSSGSFIVHSPWKVRPRTEPIFITSAASFDYIYRDVSASDVSSFTIRGIVEMLSDLDFITGQATPGQQDLADPCHIGCPFSFAFEGTGKNTPCMKLAV